MREEDYEEFSTTELIEKHKALPAYMGRTRDMFKEELNWRANEYHDQAARDYLHSLYGGNP